MYSCDNSLAEAEGIGKSEGRKWLGDRDSNPDSVVQSHECCRYTIPQQEVWKKVLYQKAGASIAKSVYPATSN
jgi:hypothetical protein